MYSINEFNLYKANMNYYNFVIKKNQINDKINHLIKLRQNYEKIAHRLKKIKKICNRIFDIEILLKSEKNKDKIQSLKEEENILKVELASTQILSN